MKAAAIPLGKGWAAKTPTEEAVNLMNIVYRLSFVNKNYFQYRSLAVL
jgi:hypothetical protein